MRGRLTREHGLDVIIPAEPDRDLVHRVIYDELCAGEFRDDARACYVDIMSRLVDHGVEGIILGCTEIGLLVRPQDCVVPLFDTAQLHARAAADYALS